MHRAIRPVVAAAGLSLALGASPALACNLNDWSTSSGSQGLSVGSAGGDHRRFQGQCGLKVLPGDSARYVQDNSPKAEPEYLARFYVFADELELSGAGWVEVFTAYRGESGPAPEFGVRLVGGGNGIALVARARNGSRYTETDPVVLPRGWHGVELHWQQSSGPANGELVLLVNGIERAALVGLNNRDGVVDLVRLGATGGSGAGGRVDFDAFVSHRSEPIGTLRAGDADGDGSIDAADLVTLVREINGRSLAGGQPDCNGDGAVDRRDLDCLSDEILRR